MNKNYKIKVNLHGSSVSWGIVSAFEIDSKGETPYNVFDTLAKAKQFALDNQPSMHHSDHSNWRMVVRRTTMEEIWEEHFQDIDDLSDWYNEQAEELKKLKVEAEGGDDPPSSPLSDEAIYDLMTSLKDSWHHFRADDIKGSLKNVAGKVFYKIKKYCNPDLDWEAMAEETWMDQSYLGSWTMFPEPEEEDNFNEYVANWKYPRKEVA